MKPFIPRGRPKTLKHPRQFPISFDEDMLEEFDSYCRRNELTRSEVLRQLGSHVLEQEKEDQQLKEEQEQPLPQQFSIFAQPISKDGSPVLNNTNYTAATTNTPIGACMEEANEFVNRIVTVLETIPDKELKRRLILMLKPFRQEISKQSAIEYKIKSGTMKIIEQQEKKEDSIEVALRKNRERENQQLQPQEQHSEEELKQQEIDIN